jgi:histidine triad (HIT) family protein
MNSCVFCAIVAGDSPAEVVRQWPGAIAIVPLKPVTKGHVIVLPKVHVATAIADPVLTGYVMTCAATLAPHPSNIITSIGSEATQTIMHLHIHVVPRAPGDGLNLPWSGGTS